MSKLIRTGQHILLLFVLVFSVEAVFAQSSADSKHPLRLFLIGNSFSQNAAKYLPQLSKEGGHDLVIGRAEIGGSSLQRHWDHVEAAERDPNDPKGKPYSGKSLKMLLSDGVWDVVTIQQASILSGDVSTYEPYARNLYNYVKKLQPNAQIVFHQTWAYRTDSKDFSRIAPKDSAKNAHQMWENLRAAYHTTARELGIPVIPNGDAFWRINSSGKWGFQKDATFDYASPKSPNLPNQTNSLHVGYRWDKEKLAFDSHHANDAGCYLGSLVWYGFLFNESPKKLAFRPDAVNEDFAKQLKKAAWTSVRKAKKETGSLQPTGVN